MEAERRLQGRGREPRGAGRAPQPEEQGGQSLRVSGRNQPCSHPGLRPPASRRKTPEGVGFCCLSGPGSGPLLERPQDANAGCKGPDFESQP